MISIAEVDLWRQVSERIDEELTRTADEILTGNMAPERYREACAYRRGLDWVLQQAADVAKNSRPPAERPEPEGETEP